ncbi:MAG: RIP metalloprotease RseP [Clostridia bacterium]|nr:RIP metalloprotease RseP [Clostridia bacterium]MBP3338067.1 RIP metalloprotease RseP [Lachnospiraceae bacterium]
MGFIWGAIKIIIVLGTLITIHELGHFLVAKACNVKVHKFSIGFGKKLFCKQKGETEYTIRLFPFGGFVQLEGEDERSDDPRAFNNKPIWQRMLIIVAGATVNIVFALAVYCGVCLVDNTYITTTLVEVAEDTAIYKAGIRAGDTIKAINGKKTVTANHVQELITKENPNGMVFLIERDGQEQEIMANIPMKEIGLLGVVFDSENNIIKSVEKNSAAEKAKLLPGYKIISINESENLRIEEYIDIIRDNPNKEMKFVFEDTEGDVKDYLLTPSSYEIKDFDVEYERKEDANIFENLYYAIDETGYYFNANIMAMIQMFTGKMENVQVMGPVGIAQEISSTEKLTNLFLLMSAISLSLGIFNLLPVPALDGGKFLILLIELIRRKPMKEKTEITIQLIGFALLITVALIVTVGDIIKLF